jgi:hypothetical protein
MLARGEKGTIIGLIASNRADIFEPPRFGCGA